MNIAVDIWFVGNVMMHPATSEQLTFLRSYVPIFADYTAKETQSKFWPRLSEDWFSRWSELDVLIKDGHLPP